MLDLGKVPVHVTMTSGYAQRCASLLMTEIANGRGEPGDELLARRLVHSAEVSMRAHYEAGVKPARSNVEWLRGQVVPLPKDAA